MRRLVVVSLAGAVVIALWWLAEDGRLTHRLGELGEAVLEKTHGEQPSWGDVADRVGEFAKEERGLKKTVGSLGGGSAAGDGSPEDAAADPATSTAN